MYIDRGKPKNSEKNLSQCHFVHHKSLMEDPGANPGLFNERPATNRLSHGTAGGGVSYIDAREKVLGRRSVLCPSDKHLINGVPARSVTKNNLAHCSLKQTSITCCQIPLIYHSQQLDFNLSTVYSVVM
jgi:hypothetical protein